MMKLFLLILLFSSNLLAAVPVLVQSTHTNQAAGNATTVVASMPGNITAGNLIVVWVSFGTDTTIPTVTDDEGNTYNVIPNTAPNDGGNTQSSQMYYAENISCIGGCGVATITATWGASHSFRSITIAEFSGVATSGSLDKSASQFQNTVTAVSSTSVTPTVNGELVVGFTQNTTTNTVTITLSDTIIKNTGATDGIGSQYAVQTTAAAKASTFTFGTARNAITSIATFKPLQTIVVLQHKQNGVTTNGVTVPITVTSTGAGNLLVVGTANNSSRNVTGVSDGTNNFTQMTNAKGTSSGAGSFTDVWYLLSSTAGKVTITITFSGASGTFKKQGFFWETSGLTGAKADIAGNVVDGVAASSTDTGAAITTTSTRGFAVGIVAGDNGITSNPKAGNEFTAGGDVGTFGEMAGASLVSTTAASHQPTWSDTTGANFASSTAAFKAGGNVRHRVIHTQ